MFAVVEILGKQYKVQEGEIVKIDNLNLKKEEKYIIEKVLLLKKNKDIKIGTPALTDVKVEATVVDNKKDKKIIVIKFKPKKRYTRTLGHRQKYSYIKIEKIKTGTAKKTG